jgi:putative alpha-1,2-mannosidase
MGNEPEFGVPWIYDFADRPDRTEEVVRRIQTQLFAATPDGLPGNDDGGAMSAWYILSALGLYPEVPGVAGFALGSPLFPQIQLHLGNGSLLSITGHGAADTSPYVQDISLNQHAWSNPWLPWSAIQNGGTLAFTLGPRANLHWNTPLQIS